MTDVATCAKCGEKRGLCGACRVDGLMQPRFCKECLIGAMNTGDYEADDVYWCIQVAELGDTESITVMRKMLGVTK